MTGYIPKQGDIMGYAPKQGDIIWLNFDPQAGHEQKGRQPAVVISNCDANRLLNTRAVVCLISSTNKGICVQPALDCRTQIQGVVLCDQVRTVDLVARKAEFIEAMPNDLLLETIDIVYSLIEPVPVTALSLSEKRLDEQNTMRFLDSVRADWGDS